ncbi:hypothetical protein ACFU98_03515 [Streptomyces sp. NPDC057575]|uniref:hypothetical protein n=1 Tax=unclassified Streptomyces TaxID=2593676 RepID=UPI00368A72A0
MTSADLGCLWSHCCRFDELVVPYAVQGGEAADPRPDWAGQWTATWRVDGSEVVCPVRDLAVFPWDRANDCMYLLRTRDQASGGELAAFATTGDGTCPVWVGRGEAGEVVGVVVLVEGMPELVEGMPELLPESGSRSPVMHSAKGDDA